MIEPKVSVVIPCYKVERYLDQCIKSVINQTLKELEIILVDDGSPDRVPTMCDEWAKNDDRIKVVHKKNGGLGMACNSGIQVATGRYIAFLDSDDWVDNEMYQIMYDTAEKHQAQMVFTGLRRVDINGKHIGVLPHKECFQIYAGKEEINGLVCDLVASEVSVMEERSLQMSAKVVLYRKRIIEENHLLFVSEREVMSEDLHFNLNALSHCDCVCIIPKYFYNYRSSANSITTRIDLCQFERIKSLYDYTSKECKALDICGDIQQRVERMFIGYVRNHIRHIARSKIPLLQQHKVINNILNDPIWNVVWKNYPIKALPLKLYICTKLMQRKQTILLWFLLSLK